MSKEFKPYVPAESTDPEMTLKAVLLGVALSALFGAANAYLAMRAGQTIAATIPAAVIAIAAFRLPFFRGGVLEQNITRTAASVGEALVAGVAFTVPAFLLGGVWRSEEHTSELQSPMQLVCRLLLEQKKQLTQTSQQCITE